MGASVAEKIKQLKLGCDEYKPKQSNETSIKQNQQISYYEWFKLRQCSSLGESLRKG